jgi:carbon-monoxide dehydrogenase medium subunit
MKAPAFAYAKPASLAEAFALLARPGAKVLAGGQSLIPTLNMRLAQPELLVDITGLPGLSGIEVRDGRVRIGALVTHTALEGAPEVANHLPLLAQAVPHVAHAAIRNRGTLGGSLALADPAAEYPACAVVLEATLVIAGARGERRVAAQQFFRGLFETDLKPGELLVAAEFPAARADDRSVFLELARRQGDYAIVGIALKRDGADLRIAFCGVGPGPVLAGHTMAFLKGRAISAETIASAQAILARDLDPPADLHHSSAAKLHLARVLLGRALTWNTSSTSR